MVKKAAKTITVAQAQELLERIINSSPGAANFKLHVPFVNSVATIGGSPCVGVSQISAGFDWDMGKVFIHSHEPLGEPIDLSKSRSRELEGLRSELHWWIPRIIENENLSAEQKLEQIKKRIEARRKIN